LIITKGFALWRIRRRQRKFGFWNSFRPERSPFVKRAASRTPKREQEQNAKNERTIMLSKVKTLKGYSLETRDGETIGKVKEFYFDDRHWTIRYLVADTGKWLSGRQVLISPYAMVA
jgi:uncharacterized protein YrrD